MGQFSRKLISERTQTYVKTKCARKGEEAKRLKPIGKVLIRPCRAIQVEGKRKRNYLGISHFMEAGNFQPET